MTINHLYRYSLQYGVSGSMGHLKHDSQELSVGVTFALQSIRDQGSPIYWKRNEA